MAISKYDDLMIPLLEVIRNRQIYKIKDLYALLAELFHLTDEELL